MTRRVAVAGLLVVLAVVCAGFAVTVSRHEVAVGGLECGHVAGVAVQGRTQGGELVPTAAQESACVSRARHQAAPAVIALATASALVLAAGRLVWPSPSRPRRAAAGRSAATR